MNVKYNEWANQRQYETLFHIWQKMLSIIKGISCAISKYYRRKCGLYWLLITFNKDMENVDPTGKAQVILQAVLVIDNHWMRAWYSYIFNKCDRMRLGSHCPFTQGVQQIMCMSWWPILMTVSFIEHISSLIQPMLSTYVSCIISWTYFLSNLLDAPCRRHYAVDTSFSGDI